jgi:hypothetical protein
MIKTFLKKMEFQKTLILMMVLNNQYKPFRQYCEDNNIILWVCDPEQANKNAIIERNLI